MRGDHISNEFRRGALEDKIGRLQDRVNVLEGAGEERGSSSSEDEHGRDGRVAVGGSKFRRSGVCD